MGYFPAQNLRKAKKKAPKWAPLDQQQAEMLLADHDVKNHLVGCLHALGANAAKVADGLLNAILNNTVIWRNADIIKSKK